MPITALENHLQWLRRKDPVLSGRLESLPASSGPYEVISSRSGPATVLYRPVSGPEVSLHSRYDPVNEAEKLIQSAVANSSSQFLVLGMGLGYHLLELIRRVPSHSRILVVEADPVLFRLALEQAPLAPLLKYPGVQFWVGLPVEDIPGVFESYKSGFALNGFTPVRHIPVIERHPEYYRQVEEILTGQIKEAQVVQNTQSVYSKAFYQNCLANLRSIQDSPGVDQLQGAYANTPAIVVSAGPSLDKNISLLQGVGRRSLILTVATALKPLLSAGITPDFVVAIDPNEISISAFETDPLPDTTCLVFHPCIPPEIVQRFENRRIVVGADLGLWAFLQQVFENKGTLGKSYSVAHTALRFARHLGCRPLILMGQDLAFSGPRSHCSGSPQADQRQRNIAAQQTSRLLDESRRRASAPALTRNEDVFGNSVATSRALETFRQVFAEELAGDIPVFNATEGGLPLPGTQNMTLREALNRLPEELQVPDLSLPRNRKSGTSSDLTNLLKKQGQCLARHVKRVQDWLEQPQAGGKENPVSVKGAETVLDPLLFDSTSMGLLQELGYPDFLEWNRRTYQIGLLNPEHDEDRIRRLTVERDRWFLPRLAQSARWLEAEFTRLAEKLR